MQRSQALPQVPGRPRQQRQRSLRTTDIRGASPRGPPPAQQQQRYPSGDQDTTDSSSSVFHTSRRRLAALGLTTLGAAALDAHLRPPPAAAASGAAAPAVPGVDCARLESKVAAAYTRAVSEALGEMGVGPEEDLQKERFKLFTRGGSAVVGYGGCVRMRTIGVWGGCVCQIGGLLLLEYSCQLQPEQL